MPCSLNVHRLCPEALVELAAWARRQGFDQPGIITTPVLLASLLLAASIPQAPMLVGIGREWTPAHLRWSGIAVAATCALVAAMRDPAARWATRR